MSGLSSLLRRALLQRVEAQAADWPDFGALPARDLRGALAERMAQQTPPRRYAIPRVDGVRVRAAPAEQDEVVATGWGAELQAKAGRDHILERAPGDRWVVRSDIFDSTYEQLPDGMWRKRPGQMLDYEIAPSRQQIDTLEGPVWADPGDYIMRGSVGERWPLKPEQYAKRYLNAEAPGPLEEAAYRGGKRRLTGEETGLWWTRSYPIAERYADTIRKQGVARVTPARLRFQNPLVIDGAAANLHSTFDVEALQRLAAERGHDGIVFRNVLDQPGPLMDAEPTDVYLTLNASVPQMATAHYRDGGLRQAIADLMGPRQLFGAGLVGGAAGAIGALESDA